MRTRGHTLAIGVAALIATLGCTNVVSSDSSNVVLRTDRSEYVASYVDGEGSYRQYGFTIHARLENRGATTVYLARCYPNSGQPVFSVELNGEGDNKGAAYNGVWACVGHDRQIQIRPGEVRTDVLHLRGPNSFDGLTGEPFGTLAGKMQLRYEVQSCRGDGACKLGRNAGESNFFTVKLVP